MCFSFFSIYNLGANGVAELIAAFISFPFAKKIGLRKALIISFTIVTIGMILVLISQWTVEIFVEIGLYTVKCSVTVSFTLIYAFAGEIFPSAVISTCIGLVGFCDRLGAMLSSLSMNVKNLFPISSIVMGIISILISIFRAKDEATK